MKKYIKLLSTILIIGIIMLAFSTQSQASFKGFDSMKSDADKWLQQGERGSTSIVSIDKVVDIVLPIGQVLMGIGVAVLIGATIIMGIKYMTGGPEARGKLKVQLIGLAISAVVIFGAYSIWSIVHNFMQEMVK